MIRLYMIQVYQLGGVSMVGSARLIGMAQRWSAEAVVLGLACAAQFMVVLDVSVVNVALPAIQRSLGFHEADLQWVASAYALTFAGLLLLGGRLADILGRRRVFVAGLAAFSLASLAGGLAASPGVLIAARAAQGLGAAVLAPATLTVLTTTFAEGARRTRALAIWTAVSLAVGAAGNLICGVITQYLSWRWILLVNLPIGALGIALAICFLAGADGQERGARVDVAGAALVTTGLGSLTYGLTLVPERGWASPVVWAAVGLGVLLLAGFTVVEARCASVPLLPAGLLRRRSIALGNALVLLTAAGFQIPMWYFLTLYMQNVLNYGPLQAGLGFLPHTVLALLIGLRLTPRLMERVHARSLIVAGALVAAVGFLWQSGMGEGGHYGVTVLGPAVLISLGGGLLNTPLTSVVTSGVDERDAGAASGLLNTTKQVGGVLGLAFLITATASPGLTTKELAADYAHAFLLIACGLVAVAALALALPVHRRGARSLRSCSSWWRPSRSVE